MTASVKCPGTGCKRKESCYLFTCEPLPKYQCFFTMACNIKDIPNCKFYRNNEEKENEMV